MANSSTHFQLFPYVHQVEGQYRSALYDFHGNRIYQIPRAATFVIKACATHSIEEVMSSISNLQDRLTAQEYLDRLASMEFGLFHSEPGKRPSCAIEYPGFKRDLLLRLSLDVRKASTSVEWKALVTCARKEFNCPQVTIFLSGDPEEETEESNLVQSIHELQFHEVEWVFPNICLTPFWEQQAVNYGVRIALDDSISLNQESFTRLLAADVKTRWFRLNPPPPRITPAILECRRESFITYRNGSVHSNSLHIDQDGKAFLWPLEKHHSLGVVSNASSFKSLINSEKLKAAWRLTKDHIDQCLGCEFRYACPNSYSFRSDPTDITSPPTNCTYQPEKGKWLQDLSSGPFDPGAGEEIDGSKSNYFEIYALRSCPHPSQAATLLDQVVIKAHNLLGLSIPSDPIRYYYYADLISLQKELARLRGTEASGLTIIDSNQRLEIHSAYPVHTHEILHALLWKLNTSPRYFVAESCATMLGIAWGSEQDLREGGSNQRPNKIIVLDDRGEECDPEKYLIRDHKGLIIGKLRSATTVHFVARYLILNQKTLVHLGVWMEAMDQHGLPPHFYEIGGSFFLWLTETFGARKLLRFYRSTQGIASLEQVFQESMSSLELRWLDFLEALR